MKENYDESLIDDVALDDKMLFMDHVIKDDYDLLAINSLLKDAYSNDTE